MNKVVLVDYGVGNLLSVSRALEMAGSSVTVSFDPEEILKADRVVLPGVGAFGNCMQEIKKRYLDEAIIEFASKDRPLLGICVGMQILHSIGKEFGEHQGLNLIKGVVDKIPDTKLDNAPHKIPQIGWAKLYLNKKAAENKLSPVLENNWFYFLHGYMATPSNDNDILAYYDYNAREITACTYNGNIYGLQFHPEKSGKNGLKLLEKFLNL